jgi:hypothetical protein
MIINPILNSAVRFRSPNGGLAQRCGSPDFGIWKRRGPTSSSSMSVRGCEPCRATNNQ